MHTVEPLSQDVLCREHVEIPMSDGIRLAARLWLPEESQQHPVPAILEYIPYRKRDLTRKRDAQNHPYLASHGYACVRVDLRGSGDSEGVIKDQYRTQELEDGLEVIRWIAEQSWCDGNVGMMGISWGGFNALQIASMRPPELKAIITACSTDDLYLDNMHYMGGCLLTDNLSEATTMLRFNSLPPDPDLVGDRWREMWLERLRESGLWLKNWMEHQRRDGYWKHGSVCEDYSAIECPVMAIGGWADGYTNAVFRLLKHLKVPRLGLLGPWGHRYPHAGVPGPAIGFLQESLRWWDHWLKEEETGIIREPMLRAWMQESVPPTTYYHERPGRWIGEEQWPSPRLQEMTYGLARDRLLSDDSPAANDTDFEPLSIQSPLSVGLFAGKWCSYTVAPDLPHDQREEDGGALVFQSEPLQQPLEILGAPVLELTFSSNQPTAMVAVRLSDVAPDDKATRVTYGLLNLTHRHSHEFPEPLNAGESYQVNVNLNNIAYQFPTGHRLRISLSTSYWALAWPPPQPVRLTVDPLHSCLKLPRRPAREEDRAIRFEPPEAAQPIETTVIEPPQHNWFVHRDLAGDRSVLEVIKDEGVYRIEEIDLEFGDHTWEWYTYQDDDFTSPRGETQTDRSLRRGDWLTRVKTRTVLTANPTDFFIWAELDAWEGDRRIYSENWDYKIPRDYA